MPDMENVPDAMGVTDPEPQDDVDGNAFGETDVDDNTPGAAPPKEDTPA